MSGPRGRVKAGHKARVSGEPTRPRFSLWRLGLSIASGFAMALAFPDFNLPLFGFVALAGFIWALLGAGFLESIFCGLLYSGAFYSLSVPWIYTVMHQYGSMPGWQAAGVMSLMILAACPGIVVFAVLLAWVSRHHADMAVFTAPFLWVALELLRTRTPDIGFPWNLLGYTASGSLALLQITSITGIYGLSFLVAAYNALIVWLLRSLKHRRLKCPAMALLSYTAAILIVALVGGRLVPSARPTEIAHLVQPNLPQSEEYPSNWDELHARDMDEIDRLTESAAHDHPGLVVWPEVPAPFSLEQQPFAQRARALAQTSQSNFLLGVIKWKSFPGSGLTAYNSAVMLDPIGTQEFEYDKIHLVPFSEYIPWRKYFFFAKSLTVMVGDFGHGTQYSVGRLPGGRFGVFICYEAIFPNEVRRFVRNGAQLLINISDDGWFGRSAARDQHLAMARVRAVENRRWLLRDTNNGITVSVDPYGRIVARLAPDIRAQLDAPYSFRSDLTLYTRWGDWFAWLMVVLSTLLTLVAIFGGGLDGKPARL